MNSLMLSDQERFENHPVYWVTWIAAAAYAASQGSRLPTRHELNEVSQDAHGTNSGYLVGDVVDVRERGRDTDHIHHLVGNVQVWCADGPPSDGIDPLQRYLHGAAWNTPATRADVAQVRSRHLLGSSRGVGIRLLRDRFTSREPLGAAEVAARLQRWLANLDACPHEALPVLDQRLIDALGANPPGRSQADVGLGTHVGTGPGEPVPAQLHKPFGEPQPR